MLPTARRPSAAWVQIAWQACAISICLTGLALGVAASNAEAQERAAGFVKIAAGTVTRERAGQVTPLKAGEAVLEGDLLRTGPDGRLGVTLKDETRLSLGPNTDLTLASFKYAPADQQFGLVLRVARGLLEYISGRLAKLAPESIRIETPASIVGVRGTHLLIGAAQP